MTRRALRNVSLLPTSFMLLADRNPCLLEDLAVNEEPKPECLQCMKDQPFASIQESEAKEVPVDEVRERPPQQRHATPQMIFEPSFPLDRRTCQRGSYPS